jgi:hypothetical protein
MATASGTDAYCGINPQYAFALQRYVSGPDRMFMAEPEGFEPSIGLYNPITV